jgi:hypothetical protein
MTATAEYNAGTRTLTVDGDGLPDPVLYGTFPNVNNPNQVTEQDFNHDFYYRGGTFGVTRTFDANTFAHDGFFITIPLSVADNTLLGSAIRDGDKMNTRECLHIEEHSKLLWQVSSGVPVISIWN